jgi:hypothetical protein
MRSRIARAYRDDWRLVIATILGLGVLAAVVTVVAVLVTRPAGPATEATARTAGDRVAADPADALPEIRLGDYMVPDEGRRMETWWWERFRTPGEPWDAADVDRFWQEPTEPAREFLRSRNDEEIERIFQNVP